MKADIGKSDINKLVNVQANVDDLDAGKLKTLPADLKKISDIVNNEVAKKQDLTN